MSINGLVLLLARKAAQMADRALWTVAELYDNLGGINEKASEYVTEDRFFLNLRNFGFERPGALVSRPGITDHASLPLATFLVIPRMVVNYEWQNFGVGGSNIVFDSGDKLYGLTNTPLHLGSSLSSGATVSYPIDYVLAKNRLYFTNGQRFAHLGITSTMKYSMPPPNNFRTGGFTVYMGGGPGASVTLPSGTYALTYGYARQIQGTSLFEYGERYAGPSFAFRFLAAPISGTIPSWSSDRFRLPEEAGGGSVGDGEGFGASFLSIYIASPGATFEFLGIVPINVNSVPVTGEGTYIEVSETPDETKTFTLVPRYLEQYKNMLFLAGFSATPSTIWHSELGDVEQIEPENFIEVRTDNGDEISCLKNFQNTLIVFKKSSVHELSGESPETLYLRDVTLEYGCVNNEAAVTFENKLWFVDKRGICEYNGPNTFIVSAAVERTFSTLDTSKAKAFHIKKRTEVWFCFGGTTLVYDYRAKAWTIYDGISVEYGVGSNLLEYGLTTLDLTYFISGSSHFPLVRFKDDVFTDRGSAITLIMQGPFFKRLGDSTQEMFRRFYLDADVPSVTTVAALNLKPDYGSSTYKSMTFVIDRFQVKKEFGISAKALSPEVVIRSSAQVTVNGYALHARFLRSV